MANQYVNKVVVNGVTKLDLTEDTITPDKLTEGYTAHDASGAPINRHHGKRRQRRIYRNANGW